jgi:hypothetical protein
VVCRSPDRTLTPDRCQKKVHVLGAGGVTGIHGLCSMVIGMK